VSGRRPAPRPGGARVALLRLPGGPVDPGLPAALAAAWGGDAPALHDGDAPVSADAVLVVDGGTDAASPAGAALRAFAAAGGPVLGVGAGFGALCAAGLLPGRVAPARAAGASPTHVRVEGRATPFTWAIPAGRVVGAGAGALVARYLPPDPAALARAGRIILRYCDAAGGVAGEGEDDGESLAGVCDGDGRVVGLFPGVVVVARALAPGLGRQLLSSLRLTLDRRLL
jgi:phosphoribosylformylglycinamidine (FGAM) synthase-like amidotransferase family enzyme